jgi:hypothetical protein
VTSCCHIEDYQRFATCPTHLIVLPLITAITPGQEQILSSSLRNFLHPCVTSTLRRPLSQQYSTVSVTDGVYTKQHYGIVHC